MHCFDFFVIFVHVCVFCAFLLHVFGISQIVRHVCGMSQIGRHFFDILLHVPNQSDKEITNKNDSKMTTQIQNGNLNDKKIRKTYIFLFSNVCRPCIFQCLQAQDFPKLRVWKGCLAQDAVHPLSRPGEVCGSHRCFDPSG